MAIKNILVAFNGSEASENALLVAAQMQKKYAAHVTGLLAHEGQRDTFARRPWVPENVREIIETDQIGLLLQQQAVIHADLGYNITAKVSDKMNQMGAE